MNTGGVSIDGENKTEAEGQTGSAYRMYGTRSYPSGNANRGFSVQPFPHFQNPGNNADNTRNFNYTNYRPTSHSPGPSQHNQNYRNYAGNFNDFQNQRYGPPRGNYGQQFRSPVNSEYQGLGNSMNRMNLNYHGARLDNGTSRTPFQQATPAQGTSRGMANQQFRGPAPNQDRRPMNGRPLNQSQVPNHENMEDSVDTDHSDGKNPHPEGSSRKVETVRIDLTEVIPVATREDPDANKFFCPFCKKKICKPVRHWESVHKNEPEVRAIMELDKVTDAEERQRLITLLRNRGTMLHNSDPKYNNGILKPLRKASNKQLTSKNMTVCPACEGTYTLKSIRGHVCKGEKTNDTSTNTRELLKMARQRMMHCFPTSDRMRLDILPHISNQDYRDVICNDKLVLALGESLCDKLDKPKNNDEITNNLRLIARFILILKDLDPTTNSAVAILDTTKYPALKTGIQKLADYDEAKGRYMKPSVATSITALVKMLADTYHDYLVEHQDRDFRDAEMPDLKRFVKYINNKFKNQINSGAMRSYTLLKAKKNKELCSLDDKGKFDRYVEKKQDAALAECEAMLKGKRFALKSFLNLQKSSCVKTISFNARRRGEAAEIEIEDFDRRKKLTKDDPCWKTLNDEEKAQAEKYSRFIITGKLYRDVPVLVDEKQIRAFKVIKKLRKLAGVRDDNPYLFGMPTKDTRKVKTVEPCAVIREYSKACGALRPELLRGTNFGKFFATYMCEEEGKSGVQLSVTSCFMGHSQDIEKNIYQKRDILELTKLSKSLEVVSSLREKTPGKRSAPKDSLGRDVVQKKARKEGREKKVEKNLVQSSTSEDSFADHRSSLKKSMERKKKRIQSSTDGDSTLEQIKMTDENQITDIHSASLADHRPDLKKSTKRQRT
ncbi:hypothetical protein QAD02_008979 [Eretmocerus hayati]|uniref:Uncharacterized protein n=1 Tax=Eretmocerus hayati TaxID=131215 RepID=A0ACC2NAF0_9HYME|nr:hypothetical protein QAD02_008979 [Eretmocerus hayati]